MKISNLLSEHRVAHDVKLVEEDLFLVRKDLLMA